MPVNCAQPAAFAVAVPYNHLDAWVIPPPPAAAQLGTPDARVKTSSSEPLANFVTVPDVPPYNISPSAVIGDKASNPAVAVLAPVPP